MENGRPEHLRTACEGSLRRLRLDRIDLFQLHRIDPKIPAEDQIGALKDLQTQGKIRHIGLSQVTVAQIEHARKIVPIVTVQNRYSLADQSAEAVLDYCERSNIGFIPWYPLAAGGLTARGGALDRAATQFKITTSQLALAWLLWRSPVILPIPGTSRVQHLEENVATASKLTATGCENCGQRFGEGSIRRSRQRASLHSHELRSALRFASIPNARSARRGRALGAAV